MYAENIGTKGFQSFKVWVREQVSTESFGSTIYTVLATMFCITTCVVCSASCVKCYYKNVDINYNVDVQNPSWDDDTMRVFVIRRIERQLNNAEDSMGEFE